MADNDDYDDITLDEMNAIDAEVLGDAPKRSATHTLPQLMIRMALTPPQIKKLQRDRTTCMVIEAPGAQWVTPLTLAAKGLGDWKFVHSAKELPRKTMNSEYPGDQATAALASGGRILGVSQNPAAYLPKAMTSSVDIVLKIDTPDNEIIRETIKLATGRTPRTMPPGIAAGLDYTEICAAIRVGSSAKACIERLVAASQSKSQVDPGLAEVPPFEALHGYGVEAMAWGTALISDLQAWREKRVNFADIERTVVFASPPGLGKTTLARSLAKSAGVPLIATSVSSWFANSPGYLDSIIKQIDQVFADAAAVAPAILFLDEIEGIPNRATLSDRGDWWLPVIGHILLKLDSSVSTVSSQLIIIGATNHPEKLDSALVRPGRMSKIIHIGKPDAKSLEGIIRQHLGTDLPAADLSLIAKLGVGASGAAVKAWVKSARGAARQQRRDMTMQDLFDQVAPPDSRPPAMVRRIAVHEAAHAVVSHRLNPGSVTSITTIGRNENAGGHTAMSITVDDVAVRRDIENAATISLAGRCGEQVLLQSISSGSGGGQGSDLARATTLIAGIHASFGMGDVLTHRATPETVMQLLTFDPVLARKVEDDLQRLAGIAGKIVEDNVFLVEAVAAALLKHRHLTGHQFLAICERFDGKRTSKVIGVQHG
jgi:cell division protease FtsH